MDRNAKRQRLNEQENEASEKGWAIRVHHRWYAVLLDVENITNPTAPLMELDHHGDGEHFFLLVDRDYNSDIDIRAPKMRFKSSNEKPPRMSNSHMLLYATIDVDATLKIERVSHELGKTNEDESFWTDPVVFFYKKYILIFMHAHPHPQDYSWLFGEYEKYCKQNGIEDGFSKPEWSFIYGNNLEVPIQFDESNKCKVGRLNPFKLDDNEKITSERGTIRLGNASVSTNHFELRRDPNIRNALFIKDVGSLNGTFVQLVSDNNHQLQSNAEEAITSGSTIAVPGFQLKLKKSTWWKQEKNEKFLIGISKGMTLQVRTVPYFCAQCGIESPAFMSQSVLLCSEECHYNYFMNV